MNDYHKSNNKFYNKLFGAAFTALIVFVVFFILSISFFLIHYLLVNDVDDGFLAYFSRFFEHPFSLFPIYRDWFVSLDSYPFEPEELIPFLAPVSMVLIFFWIKAVNPYSFSIWYRIHNHFASEEEIRKIGLLDGFIGVLGRFGNNLLRLNKCFSVLVLGKPDLGKTTNIAIPSLLESDEVSIVAVDNKGYLAKNSIGYRETFSKTFYLNWDVLDNKDNNSYWARWNPLSPRNLPPKGVLRDQYIARMSRILLNKEPQNYWDRITDMAIQGLLSCFVAKIEQACANDYFLSKILEKERLSSREKEVLISYYSAMPKQYATEAIENVKKDKVTAKNYLPIGSWAEVPDVWKGKELCLAFCTDCIIQRYFLIKNDENTHGMDGWKMMLDNFIKEAKLFNYHPKAVHNLEHLFYLSRKQRNIIFTMLFEYLAVFRKETIRERTSVSDFTNHKIRAYKDELSGNLKPTTIYSVAETPHAKFMTKFLLEILIESNLSAPKEQMQYPLLFLLDDFQDQLPLENFTTGLVRGMNANMSFIVMINDLRKLQAIYNLDKMEDLVGNATYKLLMARDNAKIRELLGRMALLGTKSVQIPAVGVSSFSHIKRGIADSNYYNRIAKGLLATDRESIVKKGQHLLLAEGYYHLPIRADSTYFTRFEQMIAKSSITPKYLLDEFGLRKRNKQDMDIPSLIQVLRDVDIDISKEEEIDMYIKDRYEEVISKIKHMSNQEAVLADDLSARWKSTDKALQTSAPAEKADQADEDWWMDENAFASSDKNKDNPFN